MVHQRRIVLDKAARRIDIEDSFHMRGWYQVELFFHCCGELVDPMVKAFATLDPAILSLGSSRLLWEDARLVPQSTVLYGNLPSKQFYSDSLVSVADVARRSRELTGRMADLRHPFILGTECDVLSVPGCECTIKAKVDAILAG